MRRTETTKPFRAAPVLSALLAGLLLSGCSALAGPEPTTSDPAATANATPTETATPTPTGPVLIADGSAEDNLPLFTAVMNEVAAGPEPVSGRAYIDALVAAGFRKADMEVTNDTTTVGNPADSIQFSVLWDGECLVGQVGPSTPAPTAVVLPELPGGGCLIGATRPIDW